MNLISGIVLGSVIGIYFAGLIQNIDLVLIYGAIFTVIGFFTFIEFFISNHAKFKSEFFVGLSITLFIPYGIYLFDKSKN